jgi:hypothetical protein
MVTMVLSNDTDGNECSLLSLFVEDQQNVDRDKKMPYILMFGRGIHDSVPKQVNITNIQEPFKKALELNVIKKKPLSLSKQLLCQELKRRNPGKKLNINNNKVDDLFSMLHTEELDELDKEYVRNEMIEEVETWRRDVGGIDDGSASLHFGNRFVL